MRSRVPLFALLFVAGSFVLPLVAHAQGIPFFGPIIDPSWAENGKQCPLGWGAIITVINRIIALLITLAIVFVAPLMIAYSGFLMVVNQGDSGKITEARKILTNTIVGIVIALAGWMIVDAIMVVLYNGSPGATKWGTWSALITSGSVPACLQQAGAPYTPVVITAPGVGVVPPTACPAPLTSPPFSDPLAQQMEGGQTVIWGNTDPRLQSCVNKFIGLVGGTVTSAYRPQAYQTHLWEIKDRWCTKSLRTNSNPACSSIKSTISAEVNKHGLSACGAVAATNSTHGSGIGVDISGINQASAAVQQAASNSCLIWRNYPGDPYHYDLRPSCTCN